MIDDRSNADEGADPSSDVKKQNPGETTTADLADDQSVGQDDEEKTVKLAKAGREDLNPDAGQQ